MLPAQLERLLRQLGDAERRRLAFLERQYGAGRRVDASLATLDEEEKLDAAVEQVRTRLKAYLREYLPRPWRPWR